MKRILYLLVAALALATSHAGAAAITLGQSVTSASSGAIYPVGPDSYAGNLVSEPGLTYSKNYLLDMAQYNALEVSAQAIFSTNTYTSQPLTDGLESTGTVRVIGVSGLSKAQATEQITVTTNVFTALPKLTFANCSLTMGRDYSRGATRNATAANLAAAIAACNSSIAASATANVIYATATAGSYANAYAFTSDNSSVTVATALMTGGADNAVLTIGAKTFTQGTDWTAGASTTTAVLALGNAIAGAGLSLSTAASDGLGNISLTSTLNGTAYNYAITSSTPTALSVSAGAMTGGANSAFVLNSQLITSSITTGFTLGLPVIYSSATLAIGGLTNQTTYYVVPFSGTQFYLAACSSCAYNQLGGANYVTVTSTNSGTTLHTYKLAPIVWTGSATYLWQTSNDNTNWSTAPSTNTVSISGSSNSPLSISWGVLGYRYLRLKFTAQTWGGLNISVPVYLKQD